MHPPTSQASGLLVFCCSLALGFLAGVSTAIAGSVTIAFGDNPGVDKSALELAAARASDQGTKISLEYFQSEDIAVQAVLSGRAEIGVGTPYQLIQKHDAPLRFIFQLSKLHFFPVVNAKYHDSWRDLNGAKIFVHGAGSGTEAMMRLMAREHGVEYGEIRHLPGSGVRAQAMMKELITATIVDGSSMNRLLEMGGGRFRVLPTLEVSASDEALYATQTFLSEHPKLVRTLLRELLAVWRSVNRDPDSLIGEMGMHGLLDGVTEERVEEISAYYREAVAAGLFSDNGGDGEISADIGFYGMAETTEPEAGSGQIDDYWDLKPLHAVLEDAGRK